MAAAYPQVIIAQRTLLQTKVSYTDALVAVQQNGARIQGFLLTGGLDAPGGGARPESVTPGELPGIRAGAQGAGIKDSRIETER